MPVYHPNILFSDCFGSTKDTTWYHRNGKCYTRKKSSVQFKGTEGQLVQASVHKRALAAWRTLSQETQCVWHDLGMRVEPHRPPFDHTAHISGHNLFVSAYHGFVTLGDEHVPEPQPFESIPPTSLEFLDAAVSDAGLLLRFRCYVGTDCPQRYRALIRLQLARPGECRHTGKMRNVLAVANCPAQDGVVEFLVPDYADKWGTGKLPAYQAYCQYRLLDTKTGYRNNFVFLSFSFDLPQ